MKLIEEKNKLLARNINLIFKKKKKKKKDNSKIIYWFIEYKTLKFPSYYLKLWKLCIYLNYESLHNHLEKEFGSSILVVKQKIKDEIRKSSITLA